MIDYTLPLSQRRTILLNRIANTEAEHFNLATDLKIVRAHPEDTVDRESQLDRLTKQLLSLETGLQVLNAELVNVEELERVAAATLTELGVERQTALTS